VQHAYAGMLGNCIDAGSHRNTAGYGALTRVASVTGLE
jgi:hypothetical protein